MCTACLCRSACLTSGRRMSGARLRARRPRLARRLAAAVHGALLVSVGAVLRLGGRVRELPRPRSLTVCLAGCPALEQSSECVECTEGAAQVALDGAHRVQSNESICAWECGQEFFLVEWGCVNCSTQGLACPPGQRWHACSERADAGCTPCPDLRLAKGSYHRRPTSSGQRETSARPNAVLACTTTRHSSPRAAAGTAGTARSWRCTRASSSSSSLSLPATRHVSRWAPCAQESGAHLARTVRIRVAAGVLRNQLPAAVAEHARAQQHRRGHLRPLRRGAWEAGRAKHMVTHILRRFTVKPILFALPRTNKFGLEN
jgi:hypothetical protein